MKQRNRFKLIETTVCSFCYILNCLSINNSSRNSDYNFYFQKENLFERLFASLNNLYVHMYTQFSFQFNLKIKEVITINISFYRDWFKKYHLTTITARKTSSPVPKFRNFRLKSSLAKRRKSRGKILDRLASKLDRSYRRLEFLPTLLSPFPLSLFPFSRVVERKRKREALRHFSYINIPRACTNLVHISSYTCMCIYIYMHAFIYTR